MQTYAIGDIHGQLSRLVAAHELIEADRARHGERDAPVIHVGDLVDRGPDSRGVLDFLIAGRNAGRKWVVLLGNHDRMFSGFMADPDFHDPGLRVGLEWLDAPLGGAATLASYGVKNPGGRLLHDVHKEAVASVDPGHVAFIRSLPTWHLRGEALFVHAGVRPGVPLQNQTEDDLVWIRRGFLEDRSDHGALIVHGHTPEDHVTHFGNRLAIDTGAGYGRALSAVVIEGREAWVLTPHGRVPAARG